MSADKIAGLGLAKKEPFIPPDQILEGAHEPRGAPLFRGDELVIVVYEDEPGTFAITQPFPLRRVRHGRERKADPDGCSRSRCRSSLRANPLVVPKGFTGIWKMEGNYRELVAIERAAYDQAHGVEAQ